MRDVICFQGWIENSTSTRTNFYLGFLCVSCHVAHISIMLMCFNNIINNSQYGLWGAKSSAVDAINFVTAKLDTHYFVGPCYSPMVSALGCEAGVLCSFYSSRVHYVDRQHVLTRWTLWTNQVAIEVFYSWVAQFSLNFDFQF